MLTSKAYKSSIDPAKMKKKFSKYSKQKVSLHSIDLLSEKECAKEKMVSEEKIYKPTSLHEVAYIQFTSGTVGDSRGEPKPVMVMHRNYLHQVTLRVRPGVVQDIYVEWSWCPLHVDE